MWFSFLFSDIVIPMTTIHALGKIHVSCNTFLLGQVAGVYLRYIAK